MSVQSQHLPQVGDPAPHFEAMTEKGPLSFPDYSKGNWCIFFAHPANFTSAWSVFSAFVAFKERWLNERNTRVVALANEHIRQNNDWSDKARRYIGIYLRAPVIEDLDFRIAHMYGIASSRRPQPGCERLALIIDPEGIIRMIIHRPLANIESALLDIEKQLDRLQGNVPDEPIVETPAQLETSEQSDAVCDVYKTKPAYLIRKKILAN
jgi:peroxiredoxin (alkyl hydroperoxide reductase subunit C)